MSARAPVVYLSSNTGLAGNVWHGSQEPWHNWDILAGRFVSEFGMSVYPLPSHRRMSHTHRLGSFFREGYPDIRTVDYWLGGNNAERYPQSRCVHHLY